MPNILAFISLSFALSVLNTVQAKTIDSEFSAYEETVIRVPYDWSWSLETTFLKPLGVGPFPLVILNHGKTLGDAHRQPRYRPMVPVREFLKMGYAVAIPMRLGFSKSDGNYVQIGCNVESDGYRQSESIYMTAKYFKAQPYIRSNQILLVGHSYGGFVSLATAAKYPDLALGVINFSGGLKKTTEGCLWSSELGQAISSYGKIIKAPSLWMYAENDEIFSSFLVRRLYDSFKLAGGKAELSLFNEQQASGHNYFEKPEAITSWLPVVKSFLKNLNLPTEF